MAMKFCTRPMHGPTRGRPGAGLRRERLAFLIFVKPPEASISPSMSFTMRERSRILPSSPIMPGFSFPGAPYRTSFIFVLPELWADSGGADIASEKGLGQPRPDCKRKIWQGRQGQAWTSRSADQAGQVRDRAVRLRVCAVR